MRAPAILIVLLAVTVTLSAELASAQVNETDSLALVALFNATGGANWRQAAPQSSGSWISGPNWLTGPVSTWHSVTVTNNRVTKVYTELLYMRGEIPPEIGHLDALTFLAITHDRLLTGPIPPEIGNLTNLELLGLYGNGLSGPIPPELGQLKNLETLELPFNQLSGSIPPEIGDLTALRSLYLLDNQLSGELPVELGNLINLRRLHLEDNPALSGPLPMVLMSLPDLRTVRVTNTMICAPADTAFIEWLNSIGEFAPHSCAVGVDETDALPSELALLPNYPNPFSSKTTISYTLQRTAEVRLTVFDLLGRQIKIIEAEMRPAGRYDLIFDASNLIPGQYFHRLEIGGFVQTRKMIVIK